jgi:hypothetical protein
VRGGDLCEEVTLVVCVCVCVCVRERERERERENRGTEKGSWWENIDLLRGGEKPIILFLKLWGLSYTKLNKLRSSL